MTIISKDALAKPYAALDVSVYTSILTSEQKIGIISRYLSYCWAWPWPSDAPVGKTRAETNALRFIEIRSRLVTGMATEGRKELSESHSPDELFLWADKTLIAMKEIYVSHHAATKHADIRQKWEDLRNEFKFVVQKSDAIPL